MLPKVASALIVVAVISVAPAVVAARESVGSRAQRILGVPKAELDRRLFLAVVEQSTGGIGAKRNVAAADQVVALASSVLAGFDADNFRDAVLRPLKVDANIVRTEDAAAAGTLLLGTSQARDGLVRRLWSLAHDGAGLSAEQRASLTRAACLLALADLVSVSPGTVAQLNDRERLRDVGGLDAGQIRELTAMLRTCAEQQRGYIHALLELAPQLDGLIQSSPESIDAGQAAEFLQRLEAAWSATLDLPDATWNLSHLLWRFHCLAKVRGDAGALKEAAAAVERMTTSGATRDPHALRWLREAVTMGGPSPRSSGTKIIRNPNDTKPRP